MTDYSNIQIETRNLVLRNFVIDDITQDYIDWLNDHQTNKYLSLNSKQTFESCESYVKSFVGRHDTFLLGIFNKENLLHIGNLTVSMIDLPNQSAWVGISIGRKEFLGKGLAKEALTSFINYSFQEIGLHSINAGVTTKNIRSLNLFIKCGFKIRGLLTESGFTDGEYEDGYILSVIESE